MQNSYAAYAENTQEMNGEIKSLPHTTHQKVTPAGGKIHFKRR